MRRQLYSQDKAVLAIYIAAKDIIPILPALLTRRSALVLKVGVSYWWKMMKCVTSML